MHIASMTSEVSKITYRVMDLSMCDDCLQPVPVLLTLRYKPHPKSRRDGPVQDCPSESYCC